MSYTEKENKAGAHPPSDGSELVPAEVQATIRHEGNAPLHEPLGAGYTVDDEGIINNYALEPKMSKAEYPSPKQQQRYILLGVVAILLVSLVVWLAFTVSQA
uniref:Ssl1498 family light-harvesting-like protein n=1 Tax=Oscillatoriales cyanobacterium SpSt-418 TaxID=2282169 RepID=A0A7C3KGH5_9CYAN